MAKKPVDIAAMLGKQLADVPKLDTSGREQIQYIDMDLIDDDPNNFYGLDCLDELAANIELCGLQQPLRVRAGAGGRYTIVSGHRRRAALRLLAADGRSEYREVPCIQERDGELSPAMRELRLIYANADTRILSSADIAKQAARVEALLYQLKEEGVDFPGRMRDHVAEACKVSRSKLARLKVIRDGLIPLWMGLYEKNEIAEDTAYELARQPEDYQRKLHQLRDGKYRVYASTIKEYAPALAALDAIKCPQGEQCCTNADRKVLVYVMDGDDVITADCAALNWLATQRFDYLAGPADLTAAEADVIKTWITTQRSDNHAIYKAVLPDLAADSEAVVNFTAGGIDIGETDKLDAAAYCGRMAGLLAGTSMKISATYAPLPEVRDVARLTEAALDAAVGGGELVLFWDGEKVKTGRAVNSLTTTTGKSDAWKKIKIVELLDMVRRDLRAAIDDSYIGKYPNTYDNKLLLATAITNYLRSLARDGLILPDFSCGIDVDAQQTWLEGQGISTVDMSAQEIKEAGTGTNVFLLVAIKPVDAMEDVAVLIRL